MFDLDTGSSEHYRDAALYDFEYRRRRADVNYYRGLARTIGGPILELGCGSARTTVPLARDGHHIVGLDASEAMLAAAQTRVRALGRAARARVTLLRADFRAFALRRRFPLVICPFNAFQHLYLAADVARFFACVRTVLAPGGVFAFDILNPDLRWLTRDPDKRWARTKFKHPATGRRYEYSTNQTYDPIAQIVYMRIYYRPLDTPGPERIVRLAHRQFFPAELIQLIERAGFRVRARHGGFSGEPLDEESESQVVECVQGT